MTLLIAVSARFSFMLPLSPVPVTLQVAAVLLAGFMLGPKWGTWSVVQYLILGFVGAPVFAMGVGGPAILFKPSFGYLLGFVLSAFLVGHIASKGSRTIWRGLSGGALGIAVIYFVGAGWLSGYFVLGGMSFTKACVSAIAQGVAPFVLVDALKLGMVVSIWTLKR